MRGQEKSNAMYIFRGGMEEVQEELKLDVKCETSVYSSELHRKSQQPEEVIDFKLPVLSLRPKSALCPSA